MLTKIENLNKKIDTLMKEKNKADAQKEVWEKKLVESIMDYKKEYGVDLSDKSFSGIKSKLEAEIGRVEAQTKEEYEKAQNIVALIEAGDIKGAWKATGVEIPEETVEEVPVAEEPVAVEKPATKPVVEQKGLQGIETAMLDIEDDFSDEDLFGSSVVKEPVVEKKATSFLADDDEDDGTEGITSFAGLLLEEDDDEDEFLTPSAEEKKPEKSGGFLLEDDDDDDDLGSFGGFGSILQGSKFDVNNR